jgi:bromodomain and PHD finger-containing protein 1
MRSKQLNQSQRLIKKYSKSKLKRKSKNSSHNNSSTIRTRSSISPDKKTAGGRVSKPTRIRRIVNDSDDLYTSDEQQDENDDDFSNSDVDIEKDNYSSDNEEDDIDFKSNDDDDDDDIVRKPGKAVKRTSASYKLKLKDSQKPKRRPGRPRKRSISTSSSSANSINSNNDNEEAGELKEDAENPNESSKSYQSVSFIEQSNKFAEITNQNKIFKLNTYEQIDLLYNIPICQELTECNNDNMNNNNNNDNNNNSNDICVHQNNVFDRLLTKQSDQFKIQQIQQKQLNDKIMSELPKVNIRTMQDYPQCFQVDYKLPENYIKYFEKTSEELDEEVEYDMDEEDNVWLKIINQKRLEENLQPITQEQFEILMDRLEKESHFQSTATPAIAKEKKVSLNSSQNDQLDQSSASKLLNESLNEDALCCICLDGECLNSNAILFCDMCNLAVHQECYGVPYIPEGQWLCRRCIQSPSAPVDCILCPNRHGAFKQTDRGQWAHVVCSIWIPEVHFANTVFLEPIIGIENIDKARWKLMCYICRKRGVGACIQCDKQNCYTAFHVTCAQQAGLYMNIQEQVQEDFSSRKKKGSSRKSNNHSSLAEVRKCAYCDIHTPIDVLSPDTRKKVAGIGGLNNYASAIEYEEAMKQAQKMRMKRARKILAERRNAPPQICLPVIPKERIQDIISRIEGVENKDILFEKLMNYWSMKRYSRNGVPLLRRLQNNGSIKKHHPPKTTNQEEKTTENQQEDSADSLTKLKEQLKEQLGYFKKLRQDLERARLLMELIRKRERMKREIVRCHELTTHYELDAFNGIFLKRILGLLIEMDKNRVFVSPVDSKEAPTYYETIKEPMDFSHMLKKINEMKYEKFEQFEYDFNLIINNCLSFNDKKSFYYKAAFKLREQASTLLKQAKRASDNYQSNNSETSNLNSTKSSKSKKSNKLDTTSASISTDASMLSPSSSISAH